jgi:DNA/RNA endonuclease YhcR with UshA esterase domain
MNPRLLSPALLIVLTAAVVGQGQTQQRIIPDAAAAANVGQTLTVEGTVASVTTLRTGTTFLNFGARYPNQTFTAVIFRSAATRFPSPQQWEGKRVRVTGTVRPYRGKPEIILNDSSQLVLAP